MTHSKPTKASSPGNTREVTHRGHNVRLTATRSARGGHLAYVYVDGRRYPGITLGKGSGSFKMALDEGERIAKKLIDDGLPCKPDRPVARSRFIDQKYSKVGLRR